MRPTITNKLFICILGLVLIGGVSCKKNNSSKIFNANAEIVDEGSVAADGCGWLVKINETDSTYNAPNLGDQYKVNGLKVQITYEKLSERFFCGMIPVPQNPGITEIKINTIKIKATN